MTGKFKFTPAKRVIIPKPGKKADRKESQEEHLGKR